MDSGYSLTIVMGSSITKLNPKEYVIMQWHTQAGSINTNLGVKIDLILPEFSATKIVMWNFHVVTPLRADMT